MQYTNLNDDLIHVGYRWLAVYGRPHDGHQVWCFGPRLPSFINEDCPIAKPEKLYVQKTYEVEVTEFEYKLES